VKAIIGFVIGILGGCFGGLVGFGGGAVMIPLMTWLAKLTQHKAHGTSLAAIIFTALVGAATYYLHGAVDWKIAAILAVSAIITARFGALYAHSLPEKKLKKAFGLFLVIVSVLVIVRGLLPSSAQPPGFWPSLLVFLSTGAVTGFLSGMMGVGGGTIMIPPMVILAGMPQHLAQGTSLLAMVPVSVSGALTHYRLGNVQVDLLYGLVVGAVVGGYIGGTAANLLPELYLKLIFSAVLIWMALKYIRK
jgi:uncharacterized protein